MGTNFMCWVGLELLRYQSPISHFFLFFREREARRRHRMLHEIYISAFRPYSPFRAYGGRRIEPHQPFLLSVMTMAGKEKTFKALPQKGEKEEEENHNLRHHRHGTHSLFFFEPRSYRCCLKSRPRFPSMQAMNEGYCFMNMIE